MGEFATSGDEVSVTIGTGTYRCYDFKSDDAGTDIECPAFEDAKGMNAIVTSADKTTVVLSCWGRFPHKRGDVIEYEIDYGDEDPEEGSLKVVSVSRSGAKTDACRFVLTGVVVPTPVVIP